METIASPIRTTTPRQIGVLAQLTASAMFGIALALVYAQAMLMRQFDAALTVFAVLMLLGGLFVFSKRRWAPLVATLLAALVVVGNSGPVIYDLTHPEAWHSFVFMIVTVAFSIVGVVGGIAATVQRYRNTTHRTPRGAFVALAALLGLCVGALLIGALPRSTGADIPAEVLARLPTLSTPGMAFDQTELRARVGEPVALRLVNTHGIPHSFDIDELNVHVPIAPDHEGLILFVPDQAGTYRFYCDIPGHPEAGMVGTLIVEP